MAIESPLTPEHKTQMDENLKLLKDLDKQIKLAKQADIDVSSMEAQSKDMTAKIKKLRQTYFPGEV